MKLYGIIKEGYYYDNNTKRNIEYDKHLFSTREAAQNYCERLCNDECNYLNAHRVKSPFDYDEDGTQRYDYVTRFWDGDDYSLVTGYIIAEFEYC